ncbi:MAG: DUF418 domain-containing protein [Cellvibrio sp.]|uniref:DUF418 domain-containing protein n=1 Tax=Cellvibrio sp. TaxID=1965322 RepID=UPI0031AE8963
MDNNPAPNLQRIPALDTARGIAVLGVLLINIYSFALPEVMRSNPLLMIDASRLDEAIWYLLHIFADTKFITMLTVVFGASLWFFGAHKTGDDPALANGLQLRRSLWLMVFGLLHAYLIWDGDVLFSYAVCALIAWHWRQLGDGVLMKISAALIVIGSLPMLLIAAAFPEVMDEWMTFQSADEIAKEVAHYQQGWWDLAPDRIRAAIDMQLGVIVSGWSSLALMLVGIVLARRGFLTLQANADAYRKLIAITLVPGLLLVKLGLGKSIEHDFAAAYIYTYGYELHFWGSTLMGIAYVLLVMQWSHAGSGLFLRRILAAVGRMALSIYIMQSIICTWLFYGYGLGWFGQLPLTQLLLVIGAIWLFQCMFACWWLNRFHYGPLEWLWRSLVYQQSPLLRR